MSCVHLFTLFYLRCHDIQYCNCNDTIFHHMLRCCIALRCLPFDVYGIISYHIILWWQYSILQQFLIPPISTSESLIFMESSSKMNHHQVATRKDPCCHGSFSTCTSNSVWLTSVTIWVGVWQGGNLGEKWKTWVQKRWGNKFWSWVKVYLNPRSTMMHTQIDRQPTFPCVFEPHRFRFQSTAKLIWIPGTNSTFATCKPGISSDSQWFEAFLKSKSTLPKANSKSTWKWMAGIRSFPFGARLSGSNC